LLQELKQTGDWEIAALPPAPKEREEVTTGPISNQQS
ncbi:3'-5' exonuclease domain-containing protein 2, partial [Bacteroides xylanisolvens]